MGPWSVPAFVGIGCIATVVSLMLYPMAGTKQYFAYRRPLFVAVVAFMPLFIYFAALFETKQGRQEGLQILLLIVGMLGFWASAVIAASREVPGTYVPALRFRPDLILPNGVLLVKGTILIGMGIAIASHAHLKTPQWNWWGFIYAFWGILTLIPIRGMYKMLLRRARLLGAPGATGFSATFVKELLLFLGLGILFFGFVHAFKGRIPFTHRPDDLAALWEIALAFVMIVPVRGWYKTRLAEGIETNGQLLLKQLLYVLGVVPFADAVVRMLTDDGWSVHNLEANPLGVAAGAILALLGLVLIALRVPASRYELMAMLRLMPGILSEMPDTIRKSMIASRLWVLAGYGHEQRLVHLQHMIEGRDRLPPHRRQLVTAAMMDAMASLPPDILQRLMRAMDQLVTVGG